MLELLAPLLSIAKDVGGWFLRVDRSAGNSLRRSKRIERESPWVTANRRLSGIVVLVDNVRLTVHSRYRGSVQFALWFANATKRTWELDTVRLEYLMINSHAVTQAAELLPGGGAADPRSLGRGSFDVKLDADGVRSIFSAVTPAHNARTSPSVDVRGRAVLHFRDGKAEHKVATDIDCSYIWVQIGIDDLTPDSTS